MKVASGSTGSDGPVQAKPTAPAAKPAASRQPRVAAKKVPVLDSDSEEDAEDDVTSEEEEESEQSASEDEVMSPAPLKVTHPPLHCNHHLSFPSHYLYPTQILNFFPKSVFENAPK